MIDTLMRHRESGILSAAHKALGGDFVRGRQPRWGAEEQRKAW